MQKLTKTGVPLHTGNESGEPADAGRFLSDADCPSVTPFNQMDTFDTLRGLDIVGVCHDGCRAHSHNLTANIPSPDGIDEEEAVVDAFLAAEGEAYA